MYRLATSSLIAALTWIQPHAIAAAPDHGLGIDASVSSVETFGVWELEGRHGCYRFVVMKNCSPEHCFDRAYLEWLQAISGPDGRYSRTEVRGAVRIAELGGFAVVNGITLAPTASQPHRFEIKATNSYTGEEGHLCVSPGGPGSYRAREGRCEAAA